MKSLVMFFSLVALILLLLPLPHLNIKPSPPSSESDRPVQTLSTDKSRSIATSTVSTTAKKENLSTATFRIQLEEGIVEMSEQDFLRYVVTCEMPLSYGEEALKAQAVASYTYFCYRREQARKAGKEADFSDVPERFEETCSEEKMRQRLGSYYEEYNQKLTRVLESVKGYTIRYDGNLIVAAYHASNGGVTASSKEIWQVDYPYLQAVASPSDRIATDCVKEQTLTEKEVKTALETLTKTALDGDPASWFGKETRLPCGQIDTVLIGKTKQSGLSVRYALGLRSADFTVAYADGTFTFTVVGYGHGVGLSQCGAGAMARQGASYKEILQHYYTNVTVEKT